jgi:hypothetical protein
VENFPQVVAVRQVQDRIPDDDVKLIGFPDELSAQRLIARFDDDALPNPLPELILRRPEFISVAADDQSVFLLLFGSIFNCLFCIVVVYSSYLTFAHNKTPVKQIRFLFTTRPLAGKPSKTKAKI